jgi:hypothetical protein
VPATGRKDRKFTANEERITDPFIKLAMDRIFLIVICASVVLLTTAIGFASPSVNHDHAMERAPLLLRIVPR